MGNWQERIKKASSEKRLQEQQAEIARREQERQREAERQKWKDDDRVRLQKETKLVSELHFRQYLEIARREVWQGLGNITEIGGGRNDWFGLRLAYRYGPEKIVESGYVSDSGVYVQKLKPSVTIWQKETFSELVVDLNAVYIRDGDDFFVGFDERKPVVTKKNKTKTFIAGSHRIPISEARPELVEETLLQFSIDRIKQNRLPRQLKR